MLLAELESPALAYKKLSLVAQHMLAAGEEPTASELSSHTGLSLPYVEKTLQWMERKGRTFSEPENKADPRIHKLVTAYHWLVRHGGKRTLAALADKAGMSEREVQELAAANENKIGQFIQGFKASWLPSAMTPWRTLSTQQKTDMVTQAYEQLSGGKHGMVSAVQAAEYLRAEKHIEVSPREIDRVLEKPELSGLDRYRVLGRYGRG